MNGYIKLYRQIFANEIWNDKEPFDRRSAWIDLLLLANHEDHTVVDKGKVIDAKRGQVNRSICQLAGRWNWSRGKVKRFLTLLENLKMCTVSSTTDGTTLTIENYETYQSRRSTDDTTDDTTDGTTVEQVTVQRTDTYNKGKKGNKGKNVKKLERDKREIEKDLSGNDFLVAHSRDRLPEETITEKEFNEMRDDCHNRYIARLRGLGYPLPPKVRA